MAPTQNYSLLLTKKKEYILKVPILGTDKTFDEAINLNEITDVIAAETLADLFKAASEEHRSFIIARVSTSIGTKNYVEYYELKNINKFLWGGVYPNNPDAVNPYNYRTPNRAMVIGPINYFVFSYGSKDPNDFNFLTNDYKLISFLKNKQIPIVIDSLIGLSASSKKVIQYRFFRNVYNKLKDKNTQMVWLRTAARLGDPLALIRAGYGFKKLGEYENAQQMYQDALKNILPEDDQNIKKQAQQALKDLEEEIKRSQPVMAPPPLMPLPMELEKPAGKREHPEEEELSPAAKKKK